MDHLFCLISFNGKFIKEDFQFAIYLRSSSGAGWKSGVGRTACSVWTLRLSCLWRTCREPPLVRAPSASSWWARPCLWSRDQNQSGPGPSPWCSGRACIWSSGDQSRLSSGRRTKTWARCRSIRSRISRWLRWPWRSSPISFDSWAALSPRLHLYSSPSNWLFSEVCKPCTPCRSWALPRALIESSTCTHERLTSLESSSFFMYKGSQSFLHPCSDNPSTLCSWILPCYHCLPFSPASFRTFAIVASLLAQHLRVECLRSDPSRCSNSLRSYPPSPEWRTTSFRMIS